VALWPDFWQKKTSNCTYPSFFEVMSEDKKDQEDCSAGTRIFKNIIST
jgi:hypothetical protein